jgi:hypothetical protein
MRKHLFLIDKGSCGLGIDLARWPDFLLAPANTQAVSNLFTVVAMCSEILAYNKVNKHEFSGKEDV